MTDNRPYHFDCAIVGAGLSGLICAQQLQKSGLRVVVLDKSRGVGGRVATRRLENTCVDHGLPFLTVTGQYSQRLIEELSELNIIQAWTGKVYHLSSDDVFTHEAANRYIASSGINAIAKHLAKDLEIWRNCRVTLLGLAQGPSWCLIGDDSANFAQPIFASALVLAIPAPQALMLLEASKSVNFPEPFLHQLEAVEFKPTLSVIAGYAPQSQTELLQLSWDGVKFIDDPYLAWVGIDSSKREQPEQPVLILHSTPEFAQEYLDADGLEVAAQKLLHHASVRLLPALDQPQWVQVHRWRYAFPSVSLSLPCLFTGEPLPLVCCGDWCGENLVESALESGISAAGQIRGIFS
ncbi:NAD(P)/FAD-dependent oxidoreductase [Gloeothece verrucosa]|uniref:Amine oxidase n=1 Tax=Gloeothece verrucosa (strain PCC 7822) TaxID=497965 RepID=E0UH66_GLOV7|nr:FAD-dependent oxidoreductase [Gloeothece verrucosa]ADN16780.1 amine oxidase [Gloeothece verrucosa PCC 7822]